ncbi:MAG: hypothetical protein KDD45_17380, partial [Bdellovibrionales bacterium]|nr:hypothetical protein [Bdellovibrionales bacterium]
TYKEKNPLFNSNKGRIFSLWENVIYKNIGTELKGRTTDLFLGSPKIIKYHFRFLKTHAKKLKNLQCNIKSPWVDIQRSISNSHSGVKIEDLITVKKSYISAFEFKSNELSKLKKEISTCLLNRAIIFN